MPSDHRIISDLRLIQENHQAVDLMNTYKGVPFISNCRITEIDGERVTMHTKDFALVSIIKEGRTRLLGSEFFEPAVATLEQADLLAGTAVLQNFSYLGSNLGDRMLVRVEPLAPIPAGIALDSVKTQGNMVDISLSGMGVVVPQDETLPLLQPGVTVGVQTELPNGFIQMNGVVLSAIKRAGDLRLSVRFNSEHEHKARIFRYLINRRTEIEADLRQEFYRLRSEARQVG